jgi:hypothetical protein
LIDNERPLSVAEIIAHMPVGTTRGSAESAIKREFDAGRIERVAPGVYRLAPAKPAEQPKPAPLPEPDDKPDDEWFAAFDAWINDPETWDRERFGPRPDEPGRRIPADVVAKGVDRNRKREERRKDREAAAARQAEADRELHSRLLSATYGNHSPELAAGGDVSAIRAAMVLGIPIDDICQSVRSMTDRRIYPANEPARSWCARPLLKKIASDYAKHTLVPSMIAAMEGAGRVLQKPADASKALPATTPELAAPESAPAALPPQPVANPDDGPAIAGALDEPSRQSILAAFARNRTPPQPAPPPRSAPPPARQAQRQAAPEPLSDAAIDELISGWKAGNLAWPRRLLGGEPGEGDCRVSRAALRRNGLA